MSTVQPGPRRGSASMSFPGLMHTATLEIIPLKGAEQQIHDAPANATVTITCSPKFGLDRTLEYCGIAARSGRQVVPHLAARMIRNRAALRDFVDQIAELGVTDLYVIGGDGARPVGAYSEAADVLEDLASFDHGLSRLGVGCYPEGHPAIEEERLWDALARKQELATYMVSQLCFDIGTLETWLAQARQRGISLPLRVGIAGPLKVTKLAEVSLRIGVGQSLRYLSKQHGMVGNVLLGRSYDPEPFVEEVGRIGAADGTQIEGVHVFSFNQVAQFVAWRDKATLELPRSAQGTTP